ncbi:MAG: sulfurtransferase complex subunit TusB [Magnetococcales bacterium]|nr:sulfurtransferase complex subunit TusB [Magnetococcales bacterium]MBF0437623.1 sulfurtransferase complex subunit TusB [Magnetococcales bacterium]
MLHTVNKSPFQNTSLESCIRFTLPGDIILLLEDGVFAAQVGTSKSDLLESAMKKNEVYALEADLKARALTNLVPGVKITDYAGFVDLVEKHSTHAWL